MAFNHVAGNNRSAVGMFRHTMGQRSYQLWVWRIAAAIMILASAIPAIYALRDRAEYAAIESKFYETFDSTIWQVDDLSSLSQSAVAFWLKFIGVLATCGLATILAWWYPDRREVRYLVGFLCGLAFMSGFALPVLYLHGISIRVLGGVLFFDAFLTAAAFLRFTSTFPVPLSPEDVRGSVTLPSLTQGHRVVSQLRNAPAHPIDSVCYAGLSIALLLFVVAGLADSLLAGSTQRIQHIAPIFAYVIKCLTIIIYVRGSVVVVASILRPKVFRSAWITEMLLRVILLIAVTLGSLYLSVQMNLSVVAAFIIAAGIFALHVWLGSEPAVAKRCVDYGLIVIWMTIYLVDKTLASWSLLGLLYLRWPAVWRQLRTIVKWPPFVTPMSIRQRLVWVRTRLVIPSWSMAITAGLLWGVSIATQMRTALFIGYVLIFMMIVRGCNAPPDRISTG